MIIWQNQNILISGIHSFFAELNEELGEPLGSAEHGLKNTVVEVENP